MGGSAFTVGDDPLHTPRMSRNTYETVKERCQRKLQDLYVYVAAPIDGPGKKDFGDIDILLALPKIPGNHQEALDDVSKALGAERSIVTKTGCAANFAIPWPSDLDDENASQNPDKFEQGLHEESAKKHIQVDVRIFSEVKDLEWMKFKHGHGDLWNIVGSMIRYYGLTVDDTALWLRIPEIEGSNKKLAKIFLSSEPREVLQFLGLPIDNYWDHPFESLQEMFEYAASCRLMYVSPIEKEPDTKNLKSNDRRRLSSRHAFREWIEEFIPQCRKQGRFGEKTNTRETVTKEAFDWFHVEEEFTTRLDAFLREKQREYIWSHSIKGSIPEPANPNQQAILYRSCLVKAMKRIILEDDQTYGIFPTDSLKDTEGNFIMDKVDEFILNNQKQVGESALARHHSQVVEHIRIKKEQFKSD